MLRANVFTGQQAHATEDTHVVTNNLVVIVFGALVTRINEETGDTVQTGSAMKSSRKRAVAQAATQQPHSTQRSNHRFQRLFVIHALFKSIGIKLFLRVNPRLVLVYISRNQEPVSTERSPTKFIDRQRQESYLAGQIFCFGMTGETGSSVDDHAASTADTGAAAKVKLERRVLLFTDAIERDEQRHRIGLFENELLHVRFGQIVLGIIPEYIEFQ